MRTQPAHISERTISSKSTLTGSLPHPMSPLTRRDIVNAGDAFFRDLAASDTPCQKIVSHFSTLQSPVLTHAPAAHFSSSPGTLSLSTMSGLGAIRSYFDLLSLNFVRQSMTIHSVSTSMSSLSIFVAATIHWRWKQSGNTWKEEVSIEVGFDDLAKVKRFILKTTSPEDTCVLQAVDPGSSLPRDGNGQDSGDAGVSAWLFGLGL